MRMVYKHQNSLEATRVTTYLGWFCAAAGLTVERASGV